MCYFFFNERHPACAFKQKISLIFSFYIVQVPIKQERLNLTQLFGDSKHAPMQDNWSRFGFKEGTKKI